MNTTSIISRSISVVVATAAVFAVSACGDEAAPAKDVSRGKVVQERTVSTPERTTRNRMDFGDESGTADPRTPVHEPAGSGTRNRMDFGEYHGR